MMLRFLQPAPRQGQASAPDAMPVAAPDIADPRRIWIEEVMGPALPRRADRREAAIAALLKDGGLGAWRAMRTAV